LETDNIRIIDLSPSTGSQCKTVCGRWCYEALYFLYRAIHTTL